MCFKSFTNQSNFSCKLACENGVEELKMAVRMLAFGVFSKTQVSISSHISRSKKLVIPNPYWSVVAGILFILPAVYFRLAVLWGRSVREDCAKMGNGVHVSPVTTVFYETLGFTAAIISIHTGWMWETLVSPSELVRRTRYKLLPLQQLTPLWQWADQIWRA